MWRMAPSEGSMTVTCTNWTLSSRGEAVKPGASRVNPLLRGQPCRPGWPGGVVSRLGQVPGEAAGVASLSCQQAPTRGDARLRRRGLAREVRAETQRGPNTEFWGSVSTGWQRPPNRPRDSFTLLKPSEGLGELRTVWVVPINRHSI